MGGWVVILSLLCRFKRKHLFLFWVVAGTVQAILLLKFLLFVTRKIEPYTIMPRYCPNSSQTTTQSYIVTMVAYSTVYIGRIIENLVLMIHIYKFLKSSRTEVNDFIQSCIAGLQSKKTNATVAFVSNAVGLSSISVIALGVVLELTEARKSNCKHSYRYYTMTIWLLDIIRYLYDVTIRMFMMLATIAVGVIWSKDVSIPVVINETRTTEPSNHKEYLEDKMVTSLDYTARREDYIQRGEKVKNILEIFQAWFILPWILFFVSSSLDNSEIIKLWKDGPTDDDGQYSWQEATYMVYILNQLILLTVAYLCSKKMNAYHSNYITRSRNQQLQKYPTDSRKTFASMTKIKKDDSLDFTPRIWGTNVKIDVENPFYIAMLLISLFFRAISDALISE